jgi:hypothetical protein
MAEKPFKLTADGMGMPLIPKDKKEKKREVVSFDSGTKTKGSIYDSFDNKPSESIIKPESEPIPKDRPSSSEPTAPVVKKKKKKKRKKPKTEKKEPTDEPVVKEKKTPSAPSSKSGGGKVWPVAVVLLIIFGGFYVWYSPRLGMPLLAWDIDDELTDQFIEEEFGEVLPDMYYHVIAVGPLIRNEPNSRAVRYYTKERAEFPWSLFKFWQVQREGMYDYDTGDFIWDT